MTREEMMIVFRGNAKAEASRIVGMYDAVHDVCRRNDLSENDARMILQRIHHDEEQDRKFTQSLKRELSARGVKL